MGSAARESAVTLALLPRRCKYSGSILVVKPILLGLLLLGAYQNTATRTLLGFTTQAKEAITPNAPRVVLGVVAQPTKRKKIVVLSKLFM